MTFLVCLLWVFIVSWRLEFRREILGLCVADLAILGVTLVVKSNGGVGHI